MRIFKPILLIFILVIALNGFSQESKKYNHYFAKDQLSFSFISSQWIGDLNDVEISPFSRGINLQMMYPVLGNKSNTALAIGFGLACQNYYLNSFINYNNDSLWFTEIPDSLNCTKYKLNTNYITVPIEIRFRTNPNNNNKSYKIYAGFRAGMLINSHTKYVGKNPLTNEKIKEKQFYIKHIEKFDYGVTIRIGLGKFMLNGYYSLSTLFTPDKCCTVTPYEIGATIVLF